MVIFSGIQPTGTKHLGNYIGGFLQYVAGQDRGDPSIYCIVDLHSITVEYDPAELRARTYDLLRADASPPGWIPSARSSSARATSRSTPS